MLDIGRSIKSEEDLSRGQEKKDSEFIHIANQAMINRFSILNHKRKKLTWWLSTWLKKKSLCRHHHDKLYVDKITLSHTHGFKLKTYTSWGIKGAVWRATVMYGSLRRKPNRKGWFSLLSSKINGLQYP